MKKYIILLFCCLLIPWSAEAKDHTINLKFTPREKIKAKPRNVSAERIFFEEIEDTRSRPREIGENREEKGKPIKILTSKEDGAGQFILSVLKNEFREKGFKVESSPNEASKIVRATLLKFWTLEASTYDTEIQIKVEIREKQGGPFFQKTYSSKGTNRGRSLSEGNYNECISDALARMTDDLFSDLEFLRVLAEKPKPPQVEAKPIEPRAIETKSIEPKRIEAKPIEPKSPEEKRLEEIKTEIKRLEELKAEEQRAREKKEAERRAEEKRLEEILARDKQEAERRAEEKRLEEIKEEVKKLEKFKADEKRAWERHEEEKRAEEKRLEELKNEVKKLEELKAIKEEILAEEQQAEEKRAEDKRREEERRAKERRSLPAKAKSADPVFGPK